MIDEQQHQELLRAIAVSSLPSFSQAERQAAFSVIHDLKKYDGRIAICLHWLQADRHVYPTRLQSQQRQPQQPQQHDITTATKLLALEMLSDFLTQPSRAGNPTNNNNNNAYANLAESDRLALRKAVLDAAHRVAAVPMQDETRILANKLAVLLEGLVLRDFPQRWTTFVQQVFAQHQHGGLWYNDTMKDSGDATATTVVVHGETTIASPDAGRHAGVKICLECFKLVAEDCTDSDFNAKISTTRRNDVLMGLNEVAHATFLPLLFRLLQQHYPLLQQAKLQLYNMHQYLQSTQRGLAQMTEDERRAYQLQVQRRDTLGQLLADTLVTLERFCQSMPLSWMFGGTAASSPVSSSSSSSPSQAPPPQHDFCLAMLHLLREPEAQCQVRAVECLEQLAIRGKLDTHTWMRLLRELPAAVQEANHEFHTVARVHLTAAAAVQSSLSGQANPPASMMDEQESLTHQYEFHRALSRLLSLLLGSHTAHITANKQILKKSGKDYDTFVAYLQLLVEMLHHPSGRIASEQISTWVALLRDPHLLKLKLLQPFLQQVLACYMQQVVRVRWQDVEEETHPWTKILEASFDDEDDYNAWMMDLRARTSLLFKFAAQTEPQMAAEVLNQKVQALLQAHGTGQPLDHVHAANQQLTVQSTAVLQLEGMYQPLENTLSGIPAWALDPSTNSKQSSQHASGGSVHKHDAQAWARAKTREATCTALGQLAQALVNWTPAYVWLQFRRATLLDCLRFYWKYHPETLLQGVDSLLKYLGLPDEWGLSSSSSSPSDVNPGGADWGENGQWSGEMTSLKKKTGVTLVSVAKKVPHHLVPWLSQLSEATRALLSSQGLIPTNQMHLYEFLSCVATAVEDAQVRSNFIADVLSYSLETLESSEVQQWVASTDALMHTLGITEARSQPASLTDAAQVQGVAARYTRLFTALNRLLSVGRRCHESARTRSGGLVALAAQQSSNFVDEGPISLPDLAVLDPFAPLWPRILPTLLKIYSATLGLWTPRYQALLLENPYQRYALAISDDEAYCARTTQSSGGVFGEGGTAGSVVSGVDRRDVNLVPKWSGWLNELRNTVFQLFGLFTTSRVLFAPELSSHVPAVVEIVCDPMLLKSMEHRHFVQFLKHTAELLMVSCPTTLYASHMGPILAPILEHTRYRLEKTWAPLLQEQPPTMDWTKAVSSSDCSTAVARANVGNDDDWFAWNYAHAGLFVGDLDAVTAEAAVDKFRIELARTYSDVLQAALALKGDWALVLANHAKEEQATKRGDLSKLMAGPRNRFDADKGTPVNADGTPKTDRQALVDARKMQRINALCHFLLLEHEGIAANLVSTVVACLRYPDAYTCRRITKICHRLLETVAWSPIYTPLLTHLFTTAVQNLVQEPKWMVGMEWDVINVVRDIYCRACLGQVLQFGGQGAGNQQPSQGVNANLYEQAKTVDSPLQGGGCLMVAADGPRSVLANLPGVGGVAVEQLERQLKTKRSAKEQKDALRDLLRTAAEHYQDLGAAGNRIFERADEAESLLHKTVKAVPDIPEVLITQSQVDRADAKMKAGRHERHNSGFVGLSAFQL